MAAAGANGGGFADGHSSKRNKKKVRLENEKITLGIVKIDCFYCLKR